MPPPAPELVAELEARADVESDDLVDELREGDRLTAVSAASVKHGLCGQFLRWHAEHFDERGPDPELQVQVPGPVTELVVPPLPTEALVDRVGLATGALLRHAGDAADDREGVLVQAHQPSGLDLAVLVVGSLLETEPFLALRADEHVEQSGLQPSPPYSWPPDEGAALSGRTRQDASVDLVQAREWRVVSGTGCEQRLAAAADGAGLGGVAEWQPYWE